MKKIIVSAALLISLVSCVNESNDYNNDHDKAYDVPAKVLITNAEKELADQVITPSQGSNIFRFFSQYWTQTQYIDESRYILLKRTVSDVFWDNLMRDVLGNLEATKKAVNVEVRSAATSQADFDIQQKNKIAIVEILEIYTYQVLVDTFGDVPYSESLDPNIVLPKYDDAAVIYPKLIIRLDAAIANLNVSGLSFPQGEIIYNGNTAKWKLFANSLKVKLGINLSDVNSALAKTTIESAVLSGVITSNTDNAKFPYVSISPNWNPIYNNLFSRNDYVPANTIVTDMNTMNDPRRSAYFTFKPGTTTYVGGIYGAANSYGNFSHISAPIQAATTPGILFESTEVNFLLAEAAARGYSVGNTDEYYYNQAITKSFESWGLSSIDAETYLADPKVTYSSSLSGSSYKEKIGHQAWIALFNRGFESWNTWRRLDFPVLIAPASATADAQGKVPVRMTYPVAEQTINTASWQAASTAIGGDKLTTKIFWDKN